MRPMVRPTYMPKNHSQRLVGSKDEVETNKQTDGRMDTTDHLCRSLRGQSENSFVSFAANDLAEIVKHYCVMTLLVAWR